MRAFVDGEVFQGRFLGKLHDEALEIQEAPNRRPECFAKGVGGRNAPLLADIMNEVEREVADLIVIAKWGRVPRVLDPRVEFGSFPKFAISNLSEEQVLKPVRRVRRPLT